LSAAGQIWHLDRNLDRALLAANIQALIKTDSGFRQPQIFCIPLDSSLQAPTAGELAFSGA